jgi:DNA repair photolyase
MYSLWVIDDTPKPVPDARQHAHPIKGRGTATRLAHRFEQRQREADTTDAGWGEADAVGADAGNASPSMGPIHPPTVVTHEQARSLLSRNDSPDIPFTWSLNPYRGCEHGCIYCYARPTHSYLNLSPGLDFETKLVAKVNAAEVLRRELARPGHEPSPIAIGSATDAYQPIERELQITRQVLEVLLGCGHAFSIVTKSATILRDVDLLAQAASQQAAYVMISLTTLDAELHRRLEPRTAAPHKRLEVVRRLAEAGIPVGVNVAPIIPFVNEPEIERLIEAAAQAGARSVHYTVVRLPWEVAPLFRQWLHDHMPLKADRVMARIQDMRGGRDYSADFAHRMKGQGVWADLIRQRVNKARDRFGVMGTGPVLSMASFVRPASRDDGQGRLF